jgi:hypothetical protein
VRYTIVTGENDAAKLSDKVTDMIRQGWEPQGGVAVAGTFFIQAMVNRHADDDSWPTHRLSDEQPARPA